MSNSKFKKRVLDKCPNAKLTTDLFGNFIVVVEDNVIAEEYLFPETKDPDKAWEYALLALKTTQNFNRTHPLKLDLSSDDIEAKLNRIHMRKNKNTKKVK